MARPGTTRRGAAACLVTSAGAVGVAAGAHVSAGGPSPSPLLLALLVPVLAGGLALVPRRLRGARVQVFAAAVLQPVLHVGFEMLPGRVPPPGRGLGAGLALMVLAHALAAGAAAWLLRSADGLVLAGAALTRWLRELFEGSGHVTPPAPHPLPPASPRPPVGRFVAGSFRRRGPPVASAA